MSRLSSGIPLPSNSAFWRFWSRFCRRRAQKWDPPQSMASCGDLLLRCLRRLIPSPRLLRTSNLISKKQLFILPNRVLILAQKMSWFDSRGLSTSSPGQRSEEERRGVYTRPAEEIHSLIHRVEAVMAASRWPKFCFKLDDACPTNHLDLGMC